MNKLYGFTFQLEEPTPNKPTKVISMIVDEEGKKYINYLHQRLQQKENIIKEVREYIERNTYKTEWGDLEQDNEDININDDITLEEFIESLLEILDKEGGNDEKTSN